MTQTKTSSQPPKDPPNMAVGCDFPADDIPALGDAIARLTPDQTEYLVQYLVAKKVMEKEKNLLAKLAE